MSATPTDAVRVIRDPAELRAETDAARAAGLTVGLVPTMGSLHDGHSSLIEAAARATDLVVVSVFVNPLQFGSGEDFETYPRDEVKDVRRAGRSGAALVWAPSLEQVYPPGIQLPEPDPGPQGDTFEGNSRPGHFAGMLKVVRRIFDVTGPCSAFFGDKDAQQLFLVKRMARDDGLPVEVVGCPTLRDPDGLALSSRNVYLTAEERDQAGCLFLALSEAAEAARRGETDVALITAVMAREIGATPLARLEYAAVVDETTFEPLEKLVPGTQARAIVAARFPNARLIDNLLLPQPA